VALPSLVGGAGRELRLSNTDRAVEDAGGTLTTYTYDENGNAVAVNAAGSRTTMTWSFEDEMLVAEPSGGGRVTMVYDGDLMRRKREEGASTAKYLWDGAQVLMETDGSDTTQARYTLAPFGYGDLVSQRRGDDSHFFHFDAIGTTRALTDADQAVTDSYIHRAFGTYVSTTGDTLNYFRYIGKLGYYQDYASPDGGFYVRRRYYAAGLGRFLSCDPVREAGVSAYGYVRNRALWSSDPSGLPFPNVTIKGLPGMAPTPYEPILPPPGSPPIIVAPGTGSGHPVFFYPDPKYTPGDIIPPPIECLGAMLCGFVYGIYRCEPDVRCQVGLPRMPIPYADPLVIFGHGPENWPQISTYAGPPIYPEELAWHFPCPTRVYVFGCYQGRFGPEWGEPFGCPVMGYTGPCIGPIPLVPPWSDPNFYYPRVQPAPTHP